MDKLQMLLFSGGQSARNHPYYHYAKDWIQNYLDTRLKKRDNVMFISWAVWGNHDADKMFSYGQEHWGQFGLQLKPFHRQPDYLKAILDADAIIVGGGSIHFLVRELELNQLMTPLKDKIESGTLYIGTSSGSVITGPTLHTSIEPPLLNIPSHKTLHILPFQLNAHFYDVGPIDFHHGPTPEARIKNYLLLNPDPKPVICLRDGSFLQFDNKVITARGEKPITLYDRKLNRYDFAPNSDLSKVLTYRSKYYKNK